MLQLFSVAFSDGVFRRIQASSIFSGSGNNNNIININGGVGCGDGANTVHHSGRGWKKKKRTWISRAMKVQMSKCCRCITLQNGTEWQKWGNEINAMRQSMPLLLLLLLYSDGTLHCKERGSCLRGWRRASRLNGSLEKWRYVGRTGKMGEGESTWARLSRNAEVKWWCDDPKVDATSTTTTTTATLNFQWKDIF